MTSGLDPFAPQEAGPPVSYGMPPGGDRRHRPPRPPLNTFAVLAPIFGVLVPPAGVAFGHLALPQLKRTGERGFLAAVCGLALGYLLCAALVLAAVWAVTLRGSAGTPPPVAAEPVTPSQTVVTSLAPAPLRPRTKIDLADARVGQCVEIQLREGGDPEALDLFVVGCEHRVGVYTVAARVSTDRDCNSTYVAVPPSRAFAVCLTKY